MIRFRVPIPPSLSHYWGRKGYRTFLSSRGRKYKEGVQAYLRHMGIRDVQHGLLELTVVIYRPKRIGDIDNYMKGLLDSLTGVVYRDDSQICRLYIERLDDPKDPRCEVEVREYDGSIPLIVPITAKEWQDLPPEDIQILKATGMWGELFPDAPQ